jgi:hypothetical protein
MSGFFGLVRTLWSAWGEGALAKSLGDFSFSL